MAVVLTYQWPVAGLVAPTTTQMVKRNILTATVAKTADADATVTVTHNMQLTAAQLAAGFPLITLTPLLAQFYTTAPFIPVATVLTNSVVITLGTGGGSGTANAQIQVYINRPTSSVK